MSIRLPDPFVVNNAPGFTVGDLVDNYPIIKDELQDGRVLQVKNGYQYWSINIEYPELLATEYSLVISAIEESKRTNSYIDILLPQYLHFRVLGDTTNTTITPGQRGSTIEIGGSNALQGAPLAGDLIQLTGVSKKVYRITSVDISSSNTWTLGVYPDLVITTVGTEKPKFNNILFQTVLTEWNTVSSINVEGLYTGAAYQFREAK